MLHVDYYDVGNACFEVGLMFVQARALWQAFAGKKLQGPDFSTWAFLSIWGLFSLSMYIYLNFWWSFMGGVGIAAGNAALLALALLHGRGESDEISQSLMAFDKPPVPWEHGFYFNRTDQRLYREHNGRWISVNGRENSRVLEDGTTTDQNN